MSVGATYGVLAIQLKTNFVASEIVVRMSAQAGHGGRSLVLVSVMAFLSYVPFEWVAKGTLILCALLFVLDPFPPVSRLISMISLVVVACLTRLNNDHKLLGNEAEVVEGKSNTDSMARSDADLPTGDTKKNE
jgi:hypothetical protein